MVMCLSQFSASFDKFTVYRVNVIGQNALKLFVLASLLL